MSINWYVFLADAGDTIKKGADKACGADSCSKTSLASLFGSIATTLTFIVGALSVIMIIVGGFRYVVSHGDPKQITEAKHTIMYAVFGVIVAIVAYAVVAFITTNIK